MRIGRQNQMLLGTGATAVEMEDCPEGAFDLQPVLDALKAESWSDITPEAILESIDKNHAKCVSSLHWLEALVAFVPALASLQPAVTNLFKESARKHQINPKWHTVPQFTHLAQIAKMK
jgi:hypothetical protein